MDYLQKWFDYVFLQSSLTINKSIKVEGICKTHLGPRLEYALIEIMVTPSTEFSVIFASELSELDNYSKSLLDAAIFGILDVIMIDNLRPLKGVQIHFLKADIHPIDSNLSAFRKAGRDAGYKVIKTIAGARRDSKYEEDK